LLMTEDLYSYDREFCELTPEQEKVLDFLEDHRDQHGYPPTRREIADKFGWASANAAETHLRTLERKGRISLAAGIPRGIKVLNL